MYINIQVNLPYFPKATNDDSHHKWLPHATALIKDSISGYSIFEIVITTKQGSMYTYSGVVKDLRSVSQVNVVRILSANITLLCISHPCR